MFELNDQMEAELKKGLQDYLILFNNALLQESVRFCDAFITEYKYTPQGTMGVSIVYDVIIPYDYGFKITNCCNNATQQFMLGYRERGWGVDSRKAWQQTTGHTLIYIELYKGKACCSTRRRITRNRGRRNRNGNY